MKLVTPQNQREIQEQLDREKDRFVSASKKMASAIKQDLNVLNWLKDYPTESAIVIIAAGFSIGYVMRRRKGSAS